MVKHIVFFELQDSNIKYKDLIVSKLNNLKKDINFIRELEVGINFSKTNRACDLSLIVVVDNKKDLVKYATHEKHVPVIEYIKSLDIKTKVVDYEF